MEVVLALLILPIVIGLVVWLVRSGGMSSGAAARKTGEAAAEGHLAAREFHIRGDDALVYFDVPVPEHGIDTVFKERMLRQAVEVMREKKSHGLPMEGVTVVRAYATQDGANVEVGSIDLDVPGELPEEPMPAGAAPHYSSAPFDPLAHLGEQEFKIEAGVSARVGGEDLSPLHDEIELTAAMAERLEARGVDPATMSARDLALGLMSIAGYTVTEARGGYLAQGSGGTTYLQVVDHEAGGYPELEEQAVNRFMIAFGESRADRGMLVTEKYGPFLVYDKERREPRVRFITRERLQTFVDGFSLR